MAMNKIPTLVLGIGGIGCRIAAGISDLLSEEDRKYVGLVGLDTDVKELSRLKEKRIRTIQTSDNRFVKDFLLERPALCGWFPVDPFLVNRGMLAGAGQVRAISRLAAISAQERGEFRPIQEEIQRIRSNDGSAAKNTLTVMVVGSITGGTGAGLFLQIPYYVRQLVKHSDGLDTIVVRGMFVSADITEAVQRSQTNRDAVHVNAYACLKELNAFYMTQGNPEMAGRLDLEWFERQTDREIARNNLALDRNARRAPVAGLSSRDAAALGLNARDRRALVRSNGNIPYDYLYLIESSNPQGGIGEAKMGDVEAQISRILFTYMFTPVADNALSTEDNFVLHDMAENGMNRYASAGYCRLIYPVETVKKYLTLCTTRDLVKEEWLALDRAFLAEKETALAQQKTDGKIKLPEIETSYPALFMTEVKDGCLSSLYHEAFIKDEATGGTDAPCYSPFLDKIEAQITDVLAGDNVLAAQKACVLNRKKMKMLSDAKREVSAKYASLREYQALAKEIVSGSSASIANVIFPPSWLAMNGSKNKEGCVYAYLSKLHPVTARFFCYSIINELKAKIDEQKPTAIAAKLVPFETVDMDPSVAGPQTANTVVSGLEGRGPILSCLSDLGLDADLARFTRTFNSAVVAQSGTITNYMSANLRIKVYTLLLQRFEALVKNYEIFFNMIGTAMHATEQDIEQAERPINDPLGNLYVYCDKAALQAMQRQYKNLGQTTLSPVICQKIFEQVFHVLSDDFELNGVDESEYAKQRRAEERQCQLAAIFADAVEGSIAAEVQERGSAIYDMTVIEALRREYVLKNSAVRTDDPSFESAVNDYITDRLGQALVKAFPMLATAGRAERNNTETVYVAFHPRCAVQKGFQPDLPATQAAYIRVSPEIGQLAPIQALMDEEFSPYELTCLRARYKYLIEDLVKYGPDSINARCYRARILNLDNTEIDDDDPDAFKTVANPHLNRYWHEVGYLPELLPLDRVISATECGKAFFYGLGYDLFVLGRDDKRADAKGNSPIAWFCTLNVNGAAIESCGFPIGNRFTDLYNAIPFNGRMRERVLLAADDRIAELKGYQTTEQLFASLLDAELVTDLCHVIAAPSANRQDEQNIFDILLSMRGQIPDAKWSNLFSDLLSTLWDYCVKLFDDDERLVNQATRRILEKIFEGCSIHGKAEINYSEPERALFNQYHRILDMMYAH